MADKRKETPEFNLSDYLTHTSYLIGLAAPSFLISFLVLLGLPLDWQLLVVAFLMAFPSYNINKMTDAAEDKISLPRRVAFLKAHKGAVKWVSIIGYSIGLVMAFAHNAASGILFLLPPLFVVAYSMKNFLIPGSRWKEITGFKNVSVTALWAFLMASYPAVWFGTPLDIRHAIIFTFVFFKFIGNMLVFDIRDMKGDSANGIRTIPIVLGVGKTLVLLHALNIAAFLAMVVPAYMGILDATAYFISLVCVYSGFYLLKVGKWNMLFVADILSDGEFVVMAMLALAKLVVLK